MKQKFTALTLLLSVFAFYAQAQTNCTGSATAAVNYACVGDTIQLNGMVSSAGNGIDCDGVDDYVNVSQKLNPGTDITLSAWINTTMVIPNRGDIITSLGPGAKGYSLNLNASTPKKVGFWVGDVGGGYLFSSTSVNDGNWHHIAATYNSATGMASIYVDGVLDASALRAGDLYSDTTMRIGDCGGFGCPGYEFDGKIDEVRIWSVARTQSEIQADMNKVVDPASAGLMAYYRFDEGTGTTTADLTGNGYDGDVSDVNAWDTPSMAPIYPDIFYWSANPDISDTTILSPMAILSSFPATYYLNYEDLTTGCTGSASVTIQEFDPVISANAPLIQCIPFSLTLDAGDGVSYLWSDGSTTQAISSLKTGYYDVTVTGATGCVKTTDSVYVRKIWPRGVKLADCNKYNYWLTDQISTNPSIGFEDFNWEFVNDSTNDTIYYTSLDETITLSDVTPALSPGATYSVRVRLLVDGEPGCWGYTCQIGILNSQGQGMNTIKLMPWHCNRTIVDLPKVKAQKITLVGGGGTAEAYEFNVYTDAACTNLLATVEKNNINRVLFFRDVAGMQTNTKYWFIVRGKIASQWSNYGDTCFVVTPASFTTNTIKLEANRCNQVLGPGAVKVTCEEAKEIVNPKASADAYAFSIYTDSLCTNLLDSVFKNNAFRTLRFNQVPLM
ncbi:MAG: LamG domain-containing protein, partial [Bacteroidia bacterium]|nr:LamG domain-containing protein [Bacteroidia bacterium]